MDKSPTFRGKDIFDIWVPQSGIKYSFDLEWRLAAAWANYKFEDFILIPTEQQAYHIAAYRCENQIKAVLSQEQARQARDRANKAKAQQHARPRRRGRR
jgi:Zn/Cd-binding protein ZinT